MTHRIYKYELVVGNNILKLPNSAKILSVGYQGGESIVLWALLDLDHEISNGITIAVVGTGWDLDSEFVQSSDFIGTIPAGQFVWHVFKKLEGPF